MLCIQKTKRREPSRQVSFCGRVIAGGAHFKTLAEAEKSNKIICEECLVALNVNAELLQNKGKAKKSCKKPKSKKTKPEKKGTPNSNGKTFSPQPPKISLEQTDIFKNKEMFIAYAVIKMKENGQLNAFMSQSSSVHIAIQLYYYHRKIKDIAFEHGINSYSVKTKAKLGLLTINEWCQSEAVFDFQHWPKSSIWKMKRILLMLALSEPKSKEV